MQDFKNLRVWHEARQLTVAIYSITRQFPSHEQFGLTSQIRRASVAVGSAIAEGFGFGTRANTARCLQISLSEAGEVYHHLITALDLHYITKEQFQAIEAKLAPLRSGIAALFFRIRPKRVRGVSRGQSAP